MYIPNSSYEILTFAIMLGVTLILGYLMGYFSSTEDVNYIKAQISKTNLDLERCKANQQTPLADTSQLEENSNHGNEISKRETYPKDSLTKILGIDARYEKKLNVAGIYTFRQLQLFNPLNLKHKLTSEQESLEVSDIIIWQQQAALAAANRWDELSSLQDELGKSTKN
tara:strand:+ start:277 stop:783 length:507 start_codon:yes stop_codon:yes gene_type:complete